MYLLVPTQQHGASMQSARNEWKHLKQTGCYYRNIKFLENFLQLCKHVEKELILPGASCMLDAPLQQQWNWWAQHKSASWHHSKGSTSGSWPCASGRAAGRVPKGVMRRQVQLSAPSKLWVCKSKETLPEGLGERAQHNVNIRTTATAGKPILHPDELHSRDSQAMTW